MPNENGFTPTQQKIVDLLSDGLPHGRYEVLRALGDEYATLKTMSVHLCYLRRIIRPRGQDIICELFDGSLHYRHIRLLVWPFPQEKPSGVDVEL